MPGEGTEAARGSSSECRKASELSVVGTRDYPASPT